MKNHHKRDDNLKDAKRLSDTERIVKWIRLRRPIWMSKREYRGVAESMEMRLSDVAVDAVGSRSNSFTVATTFLDVQTYFGAWIDSFHEGRWKVKPDIEAFKCTMGLAHLRGQSPESLELETTPRSLRTTRE